MADIPTITFSNDYEMPKLGLGTYNLHGEELKNSVKNAIDLGYRLIDIVFKCNKCNNKCNNEKEIGEAIRDKIEDGTVTRENLFITIKLWGDHHEAEVVSACKESLTNLGLDYVDLYLVHWPWSQKRKISRYLKTWKGMEECVRQSLARSIGISNFFSETITELLESVKILPVNMQVEVNINVNQQTLIDFCKEHRITVTGYSPLGRMYWDREFQRMSTISQLARNYNKTTEQIALRFVLQQGAVPMPQAGTRDEMMENMKIFDFELTSDDMSTIRELGSDKQV